MADGGTVLLDEIGEMPHSMQVKLLRVLQDGQFRPVGASHFIKVNVRIIACTNRNLEAEVANGNFREDLYYRVNVFPITIPPLRDRNEDIPLLSAHFLK
jgi:transcriptional regulator with GAF, ATPase, and Fis domain